MGGVWNRKRWWLVLACLVVLPMLMYGCAGEEGSLSSERDAPVVASSEVEWEGEAHSRGDQENGDTQVREASSGGLGSDSSDSQMAGSSLDESADDVSDDERIDDDGDADQTGDAEAQSDFGTVSPSDGEASMQPVSYPTGWLAVSTEGIPAGVPVNVVYLPDLDASAHRGGVDVTDDEQAALNAALPIAPGERPIVEHDGAYAEVDGAALLVNLPDVLPQASYDIVYAYAATSNCAGWEIPGITGERLQGYAEGRQHSVYLDADEFAVPCAYPTACKLRAVCQELDQAGYRLLVYDAYRPMTAQWQLSDAFAQACAENPVIQESLGEWGMGWYVAQGASGHNFGTDVDVAVCDAQGDPLTMPSSFDAFDESGHLTAYPLDAASITPDAYRADVAGNDACMALHAAFRNAGFAELASEWWHFADKGTEAAVRALAGDAGLDFTATLAAPAGGAAS